MSPNTTAVVLIEYQNDFTTPGGKLHDAVKPVMDSTNMLENTVEMVDEARKAGATIVYVPIQFAPGFNELSRDRTISLSKVSAVWTVSPRPISTSSCAAGRSIRSRSEVF